MDIEEEERDVVKWFEEEVLPGLVEDGRLPIGRNPRIETVQLTATDRGSDHFASCPYFLTVRADSDDGKTRADLFVKFALQNDFVARMMQTDKLCHNETVFYAQILPEFHRLLRENSEAPQGLTDELCPKLYYSLFDRENLKKSVWLMENLRAAGFAPAKSKIFLDFEHCSAAMRQIGRFHALSLSLKMKNPEVLDKTMAKVVEVRYGDQPSALEMCNVFYRKCNQRAIDYLLSLDDPPIPKEYVLKFQKLISKPYEFMGEMLRAEEPLSLVCHGDYCRNNVAFRYEADRVVDAKMFDFQLVRYGVPSTDTSFFIYLNTTQELRDEHFDDLLDIYYDNLVSTTADILSVPREEVSQRFPFEAFAEDFARHAAYAYFHVSYFQPIMSVKFDVKWGSTPEEHAEMISSVGGEEETKRIADVIVDFYKRKFYT